MLTTRDDPAEIDVKAKNWSKIAIFGPHRNIAITFDMEKTRIVWLLTGKKIETTFILFDRIHERDRQTDGQTNTARRHRPRLCIALRAKKRT